jgi:hypothetical protein
MCRFSSSFEENGLSNHWMSQSAAGIWISSGRGRCISFRYLALTRLPLR